LARDADLGGLGSRQTSGSPSSTLPPLEGNGFEGAVLAPVSMLELIGFEGAILGPVSMLEVIGIEGAVLGTVSIVLERATAGRIMSCIKRRRAAIVKVHQKYSFTHKTANIQERRKSR
jgi:hypothetical protein